MIALFGGKGSIGRRYEAILRSLRLPYRILEVGDSVDLDGIKKAIIATPTKTHYEIAFLCQSAGVPFLCEKPLSQAEAELKKFLQFYTLGFVVNNYAFLPSAKNLKDIHYDFFNTGRDGLLWDVCQLIYLADLQKANLTVRRRSWTWKLLLNHVRVSYDQIERTYVDMIKAFLENDHESLWSLKDGVEMSKLIFKLEASTKKEISDEGFFRNPSKVKLEPIIEQDLPEDRGQGRSRLGV